MSFKCLAKSCSRELRCCLSSFSSRSNSSLDFDAYMRGRGEEGKGRRRGREKDQ